MARLVGWGVVAEGMTGGASGGGAVWDRGGKWGGDLGSCFMVLQSGTLSYFNLVFYPSSTHIPSHILSHFYCFSCLELQYLFSSGY